MGRGNRTQELENSRTQEFKNSRTPDRYRCDCRDALRARTTPEVADTPTRPYADTCPLWRSDYFLFLSA